MASRNATLKAMIESEIVELMVKSKVDNIYIDETTTLAAKLSEMVTAINARAKSEDVATQISDAIDALIDGAPGTYDTLKDIADYIAAHEDVVTTLNQAIGSKLSVSVYESFVSSLGSLAYKSSVGMNELASDVKTAIQNAAAGNHSHTNLSVLEGITTGKIAEWDGKADLAVASSQPSDMDENTLFVHLV